MPYYNKIKTAKKRSGLKED
ncbi:uncharacterized protein FFMR_09643 [Fusarium fujikuroi]|nr:uncharacterized protein FFMR_09643 [Fusarium fujikuroi]